MQKTKSNTSKNDEAKKWPVKPTEKNIEVKQNCILKKKKIIIECIITNK